MQQPRSKQQTNHQFIGQVLVPPGELRTVHLGLYEAVMPEPEFRLELEPNQPDGLVWQIARLDRGDHYELQCHVQSYSDTAIHVRVLTPSA